jgi:nucleotide-binding universal stress UspA family protein
MPKITTILFPTDFSPAADHALTWATDLAQRFDANLLLVHVVPPSAYPLHNIAQMQGFPNLRDEILKRCRQEIAAVATRVGKVRTEQRVLEGAAHSEILDCAAKEGVDLIVMGTHGHTGLKHVLLGSVAERIVRLAPCPVLTVRAPDAG